MSATLSMYSGTPLGGQPLTISGLPAGLSATDVLIEAREATITSQLSGSVSLLTPPRTDSDGNVVTIASFVDVAVTMSDASVITLPAVYGYNVTRWDLALQALRTKIATISKASGYNYDITPSQIYNYQVDQNSSTGASYPQVIVYGGPIQYNEGQDSPYGFYTGTMHTYVQAVIPLSNKPNWDTELRLLQADLFRAVMLTRKSDSIALNYAVTSSYPGKVTDPSNGALGVATIEVDIELKHIATNMNSVTEGE